MRLPAQFYYYSNKSTNREFEITVDKKPIVKLVNVDKSYGNVYALEDINLDFYPGEIVSLVGDNGAGKSTLTKIISGTEKPDANGLWYLYLSVGVGVLVRWLVVRVLVGRCV